MGHEDRGAGYAERGTALVQNMSSEMIGVWVLAGFFACACLIMCIAGTFCGDRPLLGAANQQDYEDKNGFCLRLLQHIQRRRNVIQNNCAVLILSVVSGILTVAGIPNTIANPEQWPCLAICSIFFFCSVCCLDCRQ